MLEGLPRGAVRINFLKRLEQVPVAKSEQSSTFFARRERNLSFEVPEK